ncbi:cytochrome c [Magnetospira sp. QH-2]|uniref:c-type cytochrome n=1 Tax=Magnetospira sp. (strain QH-2) TaxID=1288970 RepID=UPI0018E098F5|nr:cytochrome c [Magnetospira sp. QH-2]
MILSTAAFFAVVQPAAQAVDPDPVGLFVGRVQAMKSMKQAMATIGGAVSKGETAEPAMFSYPVKMLNMASKRIAHVFPDGSQHPESKAKPDVWSDRAGFEKAAADAVTAAGALQAVVDSGDGSKMPEAFNGMYKACKTCHETYRIDKK